MQGQTSQRSPGPPVPPGWDRVPPSTAPRARTPDSPPRESLSCASLSWAVLQVRGLALDWGCWEAPDSPTKCLGPGRLWGRGCWAPFQPRRTGLVPAGLRSVHRPTRGKLQPTWARRGPPAPGSQGPVLRCPGNTVLCHLSANSPPRTPIVPPSPHACPPVGVAQVLVPGPGPVVAQRPQRGLDGASWRPGPGLGGLPTPLRPGAARPPREAMCPEALPHSPGPRGPRSLPAELVGQLEGSGVGEGTDPTSTRQG